MEEQVHWTLFVLAFEVLTAFIILSTTVMIFIQWNL